MFGAIANTIAILVGTSLGSILKQGIKERYQDALFLAMGLAASGIGLNTVIQNMPKSHYPVLFIVSLAAGSLLGAILQIDSHFNNLINRKSQSNLGKVYQRLVCCIVSEAYLSLVLLWLLPKVTTLCF